MQNAVLGYSIEEASESRNKIYKEDRLHLARKHRRVKNFAEVYNRAMDTLDAILSSTNLQKRVRKHTGFALPIAIIKLSLDELDNEFNVYFSCMMKTKKINNKTSKEAIVGRARL